MGSFAPIHWLIIGVLCLGSIAVPAIIAIIVILSDEIVAVPERAESRNLAPTADGWSRGRRQRVPSAADRFNRKETSRCPNHVPIASKSWK